MRVAMCQGSKMMRTSDTHQQAVLHSSLLQTPRPDEEDGAAGAVEWRPSSYLEKLVTVPSADDSNSASSGSGSDDGSDGGWRQSVVESTRPPVLILFFYFTYYCAVVATTYAAPFGRSIDPTLWRNATAMGCMVGVALNSCAIAPGQSLQHYLAESPLRCGRFFLIPFCVSSISSLVMGVNAAAAVSSPAPFFLVFPTEPSQLATCFGAASAVVLGLAVLRVTVKWSIPTASTAAAHTAGSASIHNKCYGLHPDTESVVSPLHSGRADAVVLPPPSASPSAWTAATGHGWATRRGDVEAGVGGGGGGLQQLLSDGGGGGQVPLLGRLDPSQFASVDVAREL